MYEDAMKLYTTILDNYEQTTSKLASLTVQIDLIAAMFEMDENNQSTMNAGVENFLAKIKIVKRIATLVKKEGVFDPKKDNDMVTRLLGLLTPIVEAAEDETKGMDFVQRLMDGFEYTVNQPVDEFCFNA